jgi:hypothetical protein
MKHSAGKMRSYWGTAWETSQLKFYLRFPPLSVISLTALPLLSVLSHSYCITKIFYWNYHWSLWHSSWGNPGGCHILLFAWLLASSQHASGRSCARPSLRRFSWFCSVFKQMLRWFPNGYCRLLVQPSRFKLIKIYRRSVEATKFLM